MQLNPVKYQLIDNPQEGFNLGLIAQDILSIDPEHVSTSGNENDREESPVTMNIENTQLVPILIKGYQEQQSLINQQQSMIGGLQLRLSRIEARPMFKKMT